MDKAIQTVRCIPRFKQSVEEGIPIQDPISMGEVSYIKDRVDEIHLYAGLSELNADLLKNMREWLQEILDNWPNRPGK